MENIAKPSCLYCKSKKVIKHGKTSTGNRRYRCRNCGKTWVLEKIETVRPDISDIAEAYLNGRTCRDLVSIYRSSPLRINQKIREFLDGCPNWEDYLDAFIPKHEPRMIFLVGKSFSCSCKGSKDNTMYLAMAVDALSSTVLGFQIGQKESQIVWLSLLDRLNCRGILCPTFMANTTKNIEDAVQTVFPYSSLRIFYHRAYRDKELRCCLSRFPINIKLVNDALKAYDSMKNKNLNKYLKNTSDQRLRDILQSSLELFTKRLKERLDMGRKTRIDGLLTNFKTRFEKFHMLKDDPYPVVNGWIAKTMLTRLENGFSRISIYSQIPSSTSFKMFSCGQMPVSLKFKIDSPLLKSFVIEISTRGLQIPMFYSKCEMKLDKCSLY